MAAKVEKKCTIMIFKEKIKIFISYSEIVI